MRFAVVSDLHANQYALDAVVADIERMGVPPGNIWCLGDVVGYGPHPVQAIRFLMDRVDPQRWVIGNHDAMLADICLPGEDSNVACEGAVRLRVRMGEGREIVVRGKFLRPDEWMSTGDTPVSAILLNREELRNAPEEDRFWRENFVPERSNPLSFEQEGIRCILVHASQEDPISRYLYPWEHHLLLPREFEYLQAQRSDPGQIVVQFFGHTHVPSFIYKPARSDEIQAEKISPGQTLKLEEGKLYLINPGGIGQPRDLDPRASYIVFDAGERTVTFRRLSYDIQGTALDLAQKGYADSLIRRLYDASAREREMPEEWIQHFKKVKGKDGV